MRLFDGTEIQARGIFDFIPTDRDLTPTYGLYLDQQWRKRDIAWEREFIDWPDFGLPQDESSLFAAIARIWELAKRGDVIEVACAGGIGRTGTVVSCLAIISGVPANDAVAWARAHYYARAVETNAQEELIARFGEWYKGRAG